MVKATRAIAPTRAADRTPEPSLMKPTLAPTPVRMLAFTAEAFYPAYNMPGRSDKDRNRSLPGRPPDFP